MPVGLDRDDLDMVLDAIGQYARSHLPDAKLRELDAADEFPEGIVREMCGEGLGVSLLFISEEFGGMGGGAMDIYRVCEQLAAIDVGCSGLALRYLPFEWSSWASCVDSA
jgi:alkylation response protein AidB-like acyl-CoA dehydrogenase